MGWGSLNGAQFEERLAAVRGAIHIEGPEDIAARLHHTVARSSAPLESITGKKPLQVKIGAPEMMVMGGGVGYKGGHYQKAGLLGGAPRIEMNVHPGEDPEETEMTFMHELGHHASALAGTAGGIMGRHIARRRGAEEARADDFAHRYHQRDPGLSLFEPDRRSEHSYEHRAAGLTSPRFKEGYQATRTTRLGHFHEGTGW